MPKMILKWKLIFGAVALLVVPMTVSIAVVAVIITQQNRTASNDRLYKSMDIIRDEISAKQTKLRSDTVQLAGGDGTGSRINLLLEYKGDDSMVALTKNTYLEVTKDVLKTARSSGLRQAAIYDLRGDLVSFAVRLEDGFLIGYFAGGDLPAFNVSTLKAEQDWVEGDDWKKLDKFPQGALQPKFGKAPPEEHSVCIEPIGESMCLVSYAPIFTSAYNQEANATGKQQCGFASTVLEIDDAFVKKISSLTGMKVNVFSTEALKTGTFPEYETLQTIAFPEQAGKWEMAGQEILLNEVDILNEGYYQGVLPLYDDTGPIGAISVLYSKQVAKANVWQLIRLLAVVFLACSLVIIPLSILFANSLTRPINAAIRSLTEAALEVSSASAGVSSSSHTLAEAASMQAASLQETSSSLEEMSSMTGQNMTSTTHGNQLSIQASENLKAANQSMTTLIGSMEDAAMASGNVARVIKSIDEIAFQTNLLALNAAVEAARAGEAGAGFAVVAEEVRTLAMKAAEAARNTQQMVGDIIRRIAEGSDLVKETGEQYRDVTMRVQKVTDLFGEISGASEEQAQGIEQINIAVAEIDRMTQESATKADESASASHQLNAQAEQMGEIVEQLSSLVGVNNKG